MKSRIRGIGFLTVAMLLSLTLAGCLATQSVGEISGTSADLPAYGVVSPQQAADVIVALQDEPQFVLLDIRTPAEVKAGHLAGAVALDFYSATFRDDLALLDRDAIYLIYCRTGNRTGQAYQIMQELGFTHVYDMGGGITQWLAADYPVCLGALGSEHICTGDSSRLPEA